MPQNKKLALNETIKSKFQAYRIYLVPVPNKHADLHARFQQNDVETPHFMGENTSPSNLVTRFLKTNLLPFLRRK
jgi:hypothetical protein